MKYKNLSEKLPACSDRRECFAKCELKPGTPVKCRILNESYTNGKCPFCKSDNSITDGTYYPHRESKKGII